MLIFVIHGIAPLYDVCFLYSNCSWNHKILLGMKFRLLNSILYQIVQKFHFYCPRKEDDYSDASIVENDLTVYMNSYIWALLHWVICQSLS